MKKYTKCLFIMFGIILGIIFNPSVVQAETLDMNYSGYWYNRSYTDGTPNRSWNWNIYEINGEVAYCIEQNILEGQVYTQGGWEETGLSDSIKERLLLIGYYGYTYPGHQTLAYRAATQGLIWDTIVGKGSNTTFWTQRYGKGNNLNISEEKAEIEKLVLHHYDKPSFANNTYNLQVGEELMLIDTNNVLENFDISVNEAEYKINENELIIKPITEGKIDVTLSKKTHYNSKYKIFIGDGIQNMYVPGNINTVTTKLTINSYYGEVELVKKDKETNQSIAQGQACLENAEYGVYEQATERLVATIKTDENGYGKSPKLLSYNSYYIQEINPSQGYLLDNTKYNFDLKGKESQKIEVFETVIKNYISILKQYNFVDENTTFLNGEKDIKFEIYYPNEDKFDEIITDKNGYATINIPYGTWRFHQVNSTEGYEKIYDFFVTVDYNSENEQYYNILNNSLSAYLQVIKTDAETNNTICLTDTTFKIYNKDTKQYVSQYVGGKTYDEFKTDENGKFVTFLKLPAGNYKLIETNSPKGYVLDTNGVDFTIGDNTDYTYTSYGATITVYYKNEPIKGKLELTKKDFVSDEAIPNTTIEIYTQNDELIFTGTTDNEGKIVLDELRLGKYYILEKTPAEGYLLTDEKVYFEIKENGEIVKVEMKNKPIEKPLDEFVNVPDTMANDKKIIYIIGILLAISGVGVLTYDKNKRN